MCPFAQKAWIALEAAKVPYQLKEVSLYGSGGKPDWFWKLNPKGTVPVLVVRNDEATSKNDDQIVLADSDLILDEMGMVMESVSSATAATNQLMVADDAETISRINDFRSTLNEFLPIGKNAVLGGNKEQMWSKLRELDSKIEDNHGSYIIASQAQPTVADCAGFPFLWRIDQEFGTAEWNNNGCENIPLWLDYCKEQPAFENSIQRSWWWWW